MLNSIFSFSTIAVALSALPNVQAAVSSSGCGKVLDASLKKGDGAGTSNSLIFTTFNGTQRTYLLHIPTTYSTNTPLPLLFAFHGRSESGAQMEQESKLSGQYANPGVIVVYPDGIDKQWQGDPAASGYNDVGFVLELIGQLETEFCIDTSRIYSSGHSNGGGFSINVLACDPVASTKIAAFHGNSAACYQGTTDANCNGDTVPITCNAGRKNIPILETHGTADGTIDYNGGPRRSRCLPSMPHYMTEYAKRDIVGDTSGANDTSYMYGGNVTVYQWGAAAGLKGIVTHYRINGMGHNWPSITGGNYFDGATLVHNFLTQYSLGDAASNSATASSIASGASMSGPPVATISKSSSASSAPGTSGSKASSSTSSSPTSKASSATATLSSSQASSTKASSTFTPSASCPSGQIACPTPGAVICIGSSQYGICNTDNCAIPQPLADGTQCTSDHIVWSVSGSSSTGVSTTRADNTKAASTKPPSSYSSIVSSSSAAAAATSSLCPAKNGTSFTSSSGHTYTILCGVDSAGSYFAPGGYKTFEACISLCSTTANCTSVAYNGQCYLKSAAKGLVADRPGIAIALLQPSCPRDDGTTYMDARGSIGR
ncbi:hypothetical protein H2203_002431 [Taxawa tesnikishii (nom. ined.)]|nr:hypothetical protein H2203_002431 [Dothideales sp. JES 119]